MLLQGDSCRYSHKVCEKETGQLSRLNGKVALRCSRLEDFCVVSYFISQLEACSFHKLLVKHCAFPALQQLSVFSDIQFFHYGGENHIAHYDACKPCKINGWQRRKPDGSAQ